MSANPAAPLHSSVRRAILGLGASQIIGYGTTYYLLSLLAAPIGADLGMSTPAILGGLSLTLFCSAFIGPTIGRWQDRAGSRIVMSTGSVIAAAGLGLLYFAKGPVGFYLAWLVIGISAPMNLYSASFTALAQLAGPQSRRSISLVTFLGGLASTLFWPFTAWLMTKLGWREIVLVFALMQLFICLPIHALMVGGRADVPDENAAGRTLPPGLPVAAQGAAFILLCCMLTLMGLINNAISVLLFVILGGLGFVATAAVFIGSLIGISQVAGRVGEMLFGERHSALRTGIVSMTAMPLAFMVLIAAQGQPSAGALFAILYGISNGLLTIARAGMILAIYGTRGYGERTNKIAMGQNFAGAFGPVIGGLLIDQVGPQMLVFMMLTAAMLALMLMVALKSHCARHGLH
jgi:predicted MFS family arabinose efflux permease